MDEERYEWYNDEFDDVNLGREETIFEEMKKIIDVIKKD